jgi:RNase H-fold protein (predicted Holliday junction resolvase)
MAENIGNSINKNKQKEYTLMEGNLLEYPIFSMQQSRVNKLSDEYRWQEKDIIGNIVSERKFRIDCVEGIPNFFDMDVFNGIMRIFVKKEYKKNEIHFTIYELIKDMNLPLHKGEVVKRVRESLERMAKTSLRFDNAFYAEKEKISKIIHLIVRIEMYEKQKGARLINMIKVVLDDELVNSIERKYFKLIDFNVYKLLAAGTPRRLYEYLEKKKYKKNKFEIGIKKLAQWIGLKTAKISQLKDLLGKASNELLAKMVIEQWKFTQENIIFYFKKSERFKEVEKDLFYLESLVRTFYETIGHTTIAAVLVREGMAVLQDLIDEGFSKEDIEYTLGWTVDNIKPVHSIKILPKIIGQALGDKESKELVKETVRLEQQKKEEEKAQQEEELKKEKEMNKLFEALPKHEQEELEEQARKQLIEQEVNIQFMRPIMIQIERNKILEQKELAKHKKAEPANLTK